MRRTFIAFCVVLSICLIVMGVKFVTGKNARISEFAAFEEQVRREVYGAEQSSVALSRELCAPYLAKLAAENKAMPSPLYERSPISHDADTIRACVQRFLDGRVHDHEHFAAVVTPSESLNELNYCMRRLENVGMRVRFFDGELSELRPAYAEARAKWREAYDRADKFPRTLPPEFLPATAASK